MRWSSSGPSSIRPSTRGVAAYRHSCPIPRARGVRRRPTRSSSETGGSGAGRDRRGGLGHGRALDLRTRTGAHATAPRVKRPCEGAGSQHRARGGAQPRRLRRPRDARAALLNLVIYADREMHARRAAASSSRLSTRHPSRVIVVLGDRQREGVDVVVQLHCHVPRPDETAQISYEQILARVKGDADERIASVVIPLLVPDLPVFLWCTGTPPHDTRRFDDLIALADRLIVDSADFARPDQTLAVMAELARTHTGRRVGITDLNCTRLTPWRELVAAFFDVDTWRPCLDNLVGVRVGFGVDMDGRDIHPSQALLLIGWLASRLGWKPVDALAPSEAGGLLFRMANAAGGPIVIRVRPRFERGIEPGDTSGVRL